MSFEQKCYLVTRYISPEDGPSIFYGFYDNLKKAQKKVVELVKMYSINDPFKDQSHHIVGSHVPIEKFNNKFDISIQEYNYDYMKMKTYDIINVLISISYFGDIVEYSFLSIVDCKYQVEQFSEEYESFRYIVKPFTLNEDLPIPNNFDELFIFDEFI